MEKILVFAALGASALFFAALGAALWCVDEKRLGAAERFLRMRKTGTAVAALALVWCVPQIEAVAWASLVPWLRYLVVAALILCYLYLDNLMARGIAGLFMMGAYSFVHLTFDYYLATGVVGAIAAWSWGIAGIVIAGKPCWLRDYLRFAARHAWLRRGVAIYTILTAIVVVAAAASLAKNWK